MPRSSSKRNKRPRPPPTSTTDDDEEGVVANNNNNNTNNDDRTASRRAERAAQRRAVLTHGTTEKRQELRLRLHLERAKRSLLQVRCRLERWDAVTEQAERLEKERQEKQEQQQQQEQEQQDETIPQEPTKKKFGGRPSNDPSTWRLKGAARPASQVYDFDVRYVDRYIDDHAQAHEMARRQVNRLAAVAGQANRLSTCPVGRTFLSLLMQVGHLSAEAHLYRPAVTAWQECLLYDDGNITTACECLLQLYVTRRHFPDAYELGRKNETKDDDTDHATTTCSAVVCYTTALAAFALLHQGVQRTVVEDDDEATTTKGNGNKNEKRQKKNKASRPAATTTTPTELQVQDHMVRAIRNNVFLAYYIVHYETFRDVMECQDELEQAAEDDDDDDTMAPPPPQSLLEEAIEYGHSDQVAVWHDLGAHHELARVLQTNTPPGGVNEWQGPLDRLLEQQQQQQQQQQSSSSKVDLVMFAGMFRTAMEMVTSQQQRR